MPCSVCGKKDPNTVQASCPKEDCEEAGVEIELHKLHVMNQKDVLGQCKKCATRLVSGGAQKEEDSPLLSVQKAGTRFGYFKENYVSKIKCCHGCLGANELDVGTQNRLTVLSTKKQKCLTALDAVLNSLSHEAGDVGIDIPSSERKRAHCIIANQYLEWYLPAIIVSFCKLANPQRYRSDAPDTHVFELATDTVEGYWRLAKGKKGVAFYDVVIGELVKGLEDHQDFPATVYSLLAAMRHAIAVRITPSHLPEDEPKVLTSPPPEHGGGYCVTTTFMDDKKESFNDSNAINHLYTAVGQCRTPVFMVGNQCEVCEVDQGEDPLILRHFKSDTAGVSLKALITAYHQEGGAFALAVDYLRPCLKYLGNKLWAASKDATKNGKKRLDRWLKIICSEDNWLLFCLYVTTCLLEASLGVSPFRAGGSLLLKIGNNPCPIVRV